MRLADYHIHTPLCRHATGSPVEYARQAEAVGLAEIGFSDHNPMPQSFDDWRMDLEQLPVYFEAVQEARAAVSIPVRLGLECDYLPENVEWIRQLAGMAPWDYLIGAVHYIRPGWDVDNPSKLDEWDKQPVDEVWMLYWAALERCIRSGLFDVIAHADLVKKFRHQPSIDVREFYSGALLAAREHDVLFEINTAGLRKDCRELYPTDAFLSMAQQSGIGIVINSDAHEPLDVGRDFDLAVAAAKRAGFKGVWFLQNRQRCFQPFDAL
ncbi:MAG: histidinol-phosphatase [Verrucomicrobiia bacterium]